MISYARTAINNYSSWKRKIFKSPGGPKDDCAPLSQLTARRQFIEEKPANFQIKASINSKP
jgi:hypothetical protein